MITITIHADEILTALDRLPRRIRQALVARYDEIFTEIREKIFTDAPGKYLDPGTIQSGVETIGSTVIGFVETADKPGFYLIVPTKARALAFVTKSGELVVTKLVRHPFMKGGPIVERTLQELKPWIIDTLEDAVIEAL